MTLFSSFLTLKPWSSFSPKTSSCHVCMCAQLYPTLCNPMDRNPPGSSDHGVFQARVLGWVAISYSRRSSLLWDWNHVSCIYYIDRQILFHCATQESQSLIKVSLNKASKEWLVSKYTQACNSVYWRKHRVGRSNRRIGFLTNVHLLKQSTEIFLTVLSEGLGPWDVEFWRLIIGGCIIHVPCHDQELVSKP